MSLNNNQKEKIQWILEFIFFIFYCLMDLYCSKKEEYFEDNEVYGQEENEINSKKDFFSENSKKDTAKFKDIMKNSEESTNETIKNNQMNSKKTYNNSNDHQKKDNSKFLVFDASNYENEKFDGNFIQIN